MQEFVQYKKQIKYLLELEVANPTSWRFWTLNLEVELLV